MKYSDSRIILSTFYIYLLPITTSNYNFNCISILFLDLSINRLYHGFYPSVVEIQIVTSYRALYGALRLSPLETLVVFGEIGGFQNLGVERGVRREVRPGLLFK